MKLNISPNEKMSKQWLEENGFDGLYSTFGMCRCVKDDLFPCGYSCTDCLPGLLRSCDDCEERTICCIMNCGIEAPRLSSKDWFSYDEYKDIRVIDYDGWDRTNFEHSFSEKITREEFDRRLMLSTQIRSKV